MTYEITRKWGSPPKRDIPAGYEGWGTTILTLQPSYGEGWGCDGVGECPLAQTLDTLRCGEVFRMAWGVSWCVVVCKVFWEGGGAPPPLPLLTRMVMKSSMNASLFLRMKLWLAKAHAACTTRHMNSCKDVTSNAT